jgi:hypothetical protein
MMKGVRIHEQDAVRQKGLVVASRTCTRPAAETQHDAIVMSTLNTAQRSAPYALRGWARCVCKMNGPITGAHYLPLQRVTT